MRSHFALLALASLSHSQAFAQITNIAPGGIPSQSSTDYAGFAEYAVDGNTFGNYVASGVTHTEDLMNSWWQVDFSGALLRMHEIRLYNRSDCCELRLSNFRVSAFQGTNEVFGQDYYTTPGTSVAAGGIESISLPPGLRADRVRVALLGFNNDGNGILSLAEVEIDGDEVGTSVCGPAIPNSSGAAATIAAFGSTTAGGFPLGVVGHGMSVNSFGYFLTGKTPGSFIPPGSVGRLCLSGNIGRFNGMIRNTQGAGDAFGIGVDTLALPINPNAPAVAGETWYFQAWFRDGATSNFTDAVAVLFQ